MNMATVRARFALVSVRHHVYLLVTVILAIGSFLIGYSYWQNRGHAAAEDIASHYHLETVLYTTQIKEEVQRLLTRHAENEAHGRASKEHAWSENQFAHYLYDQERSHRDSWPA